MFGGSAQSFAAETSAPAYVAVESGVSHLSGISMEAAVPEDAAIGRMDAVGGLQGRCRSRDPAQHSPPGSQDTVSQPPTFTLTSRSGELVRLPYHPQVRQQDHTAAKAAALADLGIGLQILTHDASAEIERGELVLVLPDREPESCPLCMLLPLSHPTSPEVNRFADFIETCRRAHPVLLPPVQEVRS